MATSNTLPNFRYHPDPVKSKVFVPSTGVCPCCGLQREWEYVGPWYGVTDLDHICPWCIASGEAASRFDAKFGLRDALEPGAEPEAQDELILRTPWYFNAQDEPWPVHCGDYCAVDGRPSPDQLNALESELAADFKLIQERLGLEAEFLKSELQRPFSPLWTQLFRCIHCGTHRLNGDYE